MNDTQTDQEIVRGLIQGDRYAWCALCDQYSTRLWRFIARLLGPDGETVADVFQETMLAAAKSGRNLDPNQTRLWSWLATIGHNQVALHWRGVFRRGSTGEPLPDTAAGEDPSEILANHESVLAIRRLLAEMPPDYVDVLTAKYVEGQSIAEMAEQLGGSDEAIRSKLARARREFRQRYQRLAVTN